MKNRVLHRLDNWRKYFDVSIGQDIRFLANVVKRVDMLWLV